MTRPSVPASGPVRSPCTSVCTIDPESGLCAGCFRTIDEIAGWVSLGDDEKRAIIATLRERRNRAEGF